MLVLAELNRLCAEAPAFALAFPDGNLPVADEYAVGFRLLELACGVLRHARERESLERGRTALPELDVATVEVRQALEQHDGNSHTELDWPEG
jgi:hypothetical protein